MCPETGKIAASTAPDRQGRNAPGFAIFPPWPHGPDSERPCGPRRGVSVPRIVGTVGPGRAGGRIGPPTGTVESHRYEMMQAIGLHASAELVRYAIVSIATVSPLAADRSIAAITICASRPARNEGPTGAPSRIDWRNRQVWS